jgi:uncharacterized protein YjbI with pentapeptide repeats
MNRGLRLNGRFCEVEIDARYGGIVGGSWEDTQEFLTFANLCRATLSSANLAGADLSGVNLMHPDDGT